MFGIMFCPTEDSKRFPVSFKVMEIQEFQRLLLFSRENNSRVIQVWKMYETSKLVQIPVNRVIRSEISRCSFFQTCERTQFQCFQNPKNFTPNLEKYKPPANKSANNNLNSHNCTRRHWLLLLFEILLFIVSKFHPPVHARLTSNSFPWDPKVQSQTYHTA